MVSEKTLKLLEWAFGLAAFLKMLPGASSVKDHRGLHKFNLGRRVKIPYFSALTIFTSYIGPVIYILLQCINMSYVIFFIKLSDQSELETYLAFLFLSAFSMSFVAQLNFLFFSEDMIRLINRFLLLDEKIRKCV